MSRFQMVLMSMLVLIASQARGATVRSASPVGYFKFPWCKAGHNHTLQGEVFGQVTGLETRRLDGTKSVNLCCEVFFDHTNKREAQYCQSREGDKTQSVRYLPDPTWIKVSEIYKNDEGGTTRVFYDEKTGKVYQRVIYTPGKAEPEVQEFD